MAQSLKRFANYYGLDLKSNDLTRPEQFASESKNAQYRKSGTPEKRKGYQTRASSQGGYGLFTYNRVNPFTAAQEAEVISLNGSAWKQQSSLLLVAYTGSEAISLISIYYDVLTTQYRCQLLAGQSIVLDMALGLGFDEASPVTINDLKTAIDALTDFTATVTGSTTTPAAFIKMVRDYELVGTPYVGEAFYDTEINKTVTSPFAGTITNKNSLDLENITSVQLINNIYFSNGYDYVQKYDGQTIYRAGLPTPASITSALGAAGAVTGTKYYHIMQYVQIDNSGNVIEGNTLEVTAGLDPVAQKMDVTVANIQAGSGFNTNCAIVNGAQVAVNTITVDDGSGGSHTMKVGDTAYFLNGATYVERVVTAIAATTITVAGAAVTVADNAVISNNLRIAIWRNETSAVTPTTFFEVVEVPNNSFAATQVYTDNILDVNLGAQLIEPLTDRSPPPKGKYVSAFRNQMVILGTIEDPTLFSWSDTESPEYFPVDANSSPVDTVSGDIITGGAPNNELFAIFKNTSIHIVTGDISTGAIRIDQLTYDIGCVAHATIQDLNGTLAFLTDKGPYYMSGGQVPKPLGDDRVATVLDENAMSDEIKLFLFGTQVIGEEQKLKLKRAVGFNNRLTDKYLLYLPTESLVGSDRYSNTNSIILSYDYERDAWLVWDNINMAGGMTFLNKEIYFRERRYSDFNSRVDCNMYAINNLNDAWDYQDNNDPVNFDYSPQWESLGEPSLLKRFTRFRFFNFEDTPNNDFDLTVRVETNYVRGVTRGEFMLSNVGGGYGVSPYSTTPYGNPSEPAIKHKLNPGRVRSMRLRFLNNEPQQNIILPGWEIEYDAPFKIGFKS